MDIFAWKQCDLNDDDTLDLCTTTDLINTEENEGEKEPDNPLLRNPQGNGFFNIQLSSGVGCFFFLSCNWITLQIDIQRYTRVCEATTFLNVCKVFHNVCHDFILGLGWQWTQRQPIAIDSFREVVNKIEALGERARNNFLKIYQIQTSSLSSFICKVSCNFYLMYFWVCLENVRYWQKYYFWCWYGDNLIIEASSVFIDQCWYVC